MDKSNTSKASLILIATALYAAPMSASAAQVAVQWGTADDIVTATLNSGRPDRSFNFSSYYSPIPDASYYPNAALRTPSFYAAAGMDTTSGANQRIDGGQIVNGAVSNDTIRYFLNDTNITEMRLMTMWHSDDFLVTGELLGMTHVGSATKGGQGANFGSDLHIIIQTANSNYYASQDVDFGGTLDVSSATWRLFNPITSHAASIVDSSVAVDVSADNILAVGFYGVSYDDGTNQMNHYTEGFTVTVVPEPSSYALIGGCLALSSVMLRRRQR